jgi:mevalonate kinase
MPAISATAPGKIILFGEHAVVYGEPAIAAPLRALQARAIVQPEISGVSGQILIEAPDISLSSDINYLEVNHPLRAAITAVVGERDLSEVPACRVLVSSTIPLSSGLGSSAAISTALIRAFSAFLGMRLTDDQISQFAFEIEKIHHGSPSGIDNSVVVFNQPVYYQKGLPMEFLSIPNPFSLLIIDSGSPGDTRKAVSAVQESWLKEPDKFNQIFSDIGSLTQNAKELIANGNIRPLGPLMNENHRVLQNLGVSTPRLDHLVQIAKDAGALGAKLSGGGLGGHLIALIDDQAEAVTESLLKEGAEGVFLTVVGKPVSPGIAG